MTDERLDELERLAAAATPGPWEAEDCGGPPGGGCYHVAVSRDATTTERQGGAPEKMCMFGTSSVRHADALLIAAARTAVPDLCREVRRLRAELAARDDRWQRAVGCSLETVEARRE